MHSIESKNDSGSGSSRINYFGNRNLRKSEINYNKDLAGKFNNQPSFKEFTMRRNSENLNKSKNYYTPENIAMKETKTNNYMSKDADESLENEAVKVKYSFKVSAINPQEEHSQIAGREKYDSEFRPLTKQKEYLSIKRPLNPSEERNRKRSPVKVETDPNVPSIFTENEKKDKPTIETEQMHESSFRDHETDEAIQQIDVPKLNKTKKQNSFDSFDKREDSKLGVFEEQKVPMDSSKYVKPSSAK